MGPDGSRSTLTVAVILAGDPDGSVGASVKLGSIVRELEPLVGRVIVIGSALRGWRRLLVLTLHVRPSRRRWTANYRKSVLGFRLRSRQVARALAAQKDHVDVTLQVGITTEVVGPGRAPNVVYTDFFSPLSHARPTLGRASSSARSRRAWERLERRVLDAAAHVAVRSGFVRDAMMAAGIPADHISVVGGGFNPLPISGTRTTDESSFRFLSIGDDFHRKGVDILLDAFARVRQQRQDVTLTVVTHLPAGVSLPPGVTVKAPTWDRAVVESWYSNSDAFVLASRLETWGDVLIEAMYHDLPCVGVADTPMADIIADGVTGLLVPGEDPLALSVALDTLASDRERSVVLGRQGREIAQQEFVWAKVVGALVEHLERAAENAT